MENLLKKIKPDLPKLKKFITNSTAKELSALSEPCYYPKTKKFYFDILNLLGITDKDFKKFIQQNYKGTKAEKWNLWKDPGTNILVFVMYLFLKNKDQKTFRITVLYYMIIQYSRLMFKQIRYCNTDTFKYTLDNLTRTHLFVREKTIPNSLFYLANVLSERYKNDIHDWNIEKIIAFIGVARHRISQSIKSFAQSYYKFHQTGFIIKTQREDQDDENFYQYKVLERGQKVIDTVVKKITIYKVIDRKAFDEAQKISMVKTSVATLVVNGLTNNKFENDIKIALQLFIKGLTDINMICGKNYISYINEINIYKGVN